LRALYLHYARTCRPTGELANAVHFRLNCVAEIYRLLPALAYQQAFLYIRLGHFLFCNAYFYAELAIFFEMANNGLIPYEIFFFLIFILL